MRVLIVKTSSLGDIVHTLPAITLAKRALPEIQIDWLAEESFIDIPDMHPAINNAISMAWRRWRKNLFKLKTWREIFCLIKTLKKQKYDLVIDAQGLLKSAIFTRLTGCKRIVGFDKQSARETIATYFYHEKIFAKKSQHAILRTQELISKALDFVVAGKVVLDSGLKNSLVKQNLNENYVIFLHGTTWTTKHWSEEHWQSLAEKFSHTGRKIYFPWGNEIEKLRAESIARKVSDCIVLPKQTIRELAIKIANAKAVIAVDSGLAHLAAALNTPVYGLYGPTDPNLTGLLGSENCHNMTTKQTLSCQPCLRSTCPIDNKAPCMTTLLPEEIFQAVCTEL